MKILAAQSLFCLMLLTNCTGRKSAEVNSRTEDSLASIQFPILIEGGKKAVYRFGKMTPRGLKYFYDTVDVNDERGVLSDSLKATFLSPLSISGVERDNIPAIIAISVPGLWEETIFGKIDSTGSLTINYVDEIRLESGESIAFKPGSWSAEFYNDSTTVKIMATLSETATGNHLAGEGKLLLLEDDIEEREVFLVCKKESTGIQTK